MKYLIYFVAAFLILLYSCEEREVLMPSYESIAENAEYDGFKISQSEALAISDSFRVKSGTRSSCFNLAGVDYVTDVSTRSHTGSDTVAYIFNYRNNGGFTIVAADNRVSPILAYSDNGYFTSENVIAKENFCDRIGDYLRNAIAKGGESKIPKEELESCAVVSPVVKGFMRQGAPFNKYIVMEHSDLGSPPAGCVAVACATVMLYSADTLRYHNSLFKLKSIREGFSSSSQSTRSNNAKRIVGVDVSYAYNRAVDSIAKLLYWIGKDVEMEYDSTKSGTQTIKARNLLERLSFKPSSMSPYNNGVTVAMYLVDGYIVNVKGSGHSWIIDGCQYCIFSGRVIKPIMHCDWGWGGYCNGYFDGSVFESQAGDFSPTEYYAVKIADSVLN